MNYTYIVDQYYDECDNPREWDNLGVMVTWHGRYTLGDEQPRLEPADWAADLKRKHPRAVILQLFLYDHSGITISTEPFSCSWDSGQIGYIYTTLERARDLGHDWKRLTKARREALKDMLRGEVKTYDQYIRGDIYRFTIENEDGEILDSCGGFYDREECEQEAKALVKYYQDNDRKAA